MSRLSSVKRLGRNNKPRGTSHQITSVLDDLGNAKFVCAIAHGLPSGAVIVIHDAGVDYNGTATISSVTATTFTTSQTYTTDATGFWDYT